MRRWRFDYAWIAERVALEVEGGVFMAGGGRHSRGAGFRKDIEKYNAAAALGWRIVRALPEQIASGIALQAVEAALLPSARELEVAKADPLSAEGKTK